MFYALSALSCWYYLFYLGYFILFHTVYMALRTRTIPVGWQLVVPEACIFGVAALLSPLLVKMVGSGIPVNIEGGDLFVADVFGWFAFPPFHALAPLGKSIYSRLAGNSWESTVYLGLINILVLTWLCFAVRDKDRRLISYLLSGMLVFGVIACGERLHILGYSTIPMPGMLLSKLPLAGNVRTPSRAIVLVYLFLAIAIGYAVAMARNRWRQDGARWGLAVVALLTVLDFYPVRRLPTTQVACSAGLAVIRDDPETDFGVLDLPTTGYSEEDFYMMQQAACHRRPILQGMTSRNVVDTLRDALESVDIKEQQRQLVSSKVKYIVLHSHFDAIGLRFIWSESDGQLDQYLHSYPSIYDSPSLKILRVY